MGSAFFIIFFIIAVLNFVSAQSEKEIKKKDGGWKPQPNNTQSSGQNHTTGTTSSNNPWGSASQSSDANKYGQKSFGKKQKTRSPKWTETAAQSARRQATIQATRKIKDRLEDRASRRKDPADQNRNRTADWGVRESRGLLSVSNLLILGLLVFVLAALFL